MLVLVEPNDEARLFQGWDPGTVLVPVAVRLLLAWNGDGPWSSLLLEPNACLAGRLFPWRDRAVRLIPAAKGEEPWAVAELGGGTLLYL